MPDFNVTHENLGFHLTASDITEAVRLACDTVSLEHAHTQKMGEIYEVWGFDPQDFAPSRMIIRQLGQ